MGRKAIAAVGSRTQAVQSVAWALLLPLCLRNDFLVTQFEIVLSDHVLKARDTSDSRYCLRVVWNVATKVHSDGQPIDSAVAAAMRNEMPVSAQLAQFISTQWLHFAAHHCSLSASWRLESKHFQWRQAVSTAFFPHVTLTRYCKLCTPRHRTLTLTRHSLLSKRHILHSTCWIILLDSKIGVRASQPRFLCNSQFLNGFFWTV